MPILSRRDCFGTDPDRTTKTAAGRLGGRMVSVLALIAAMALGGCDNTRRDMTDAIDGVIRQKVCFSLEDMSGTAWPLRVRRGQSWTSEKPLDPILVAMQSAGYIKTTQERQVIGFVPTAIDVIMPTDEAKTWWDPKEGYCVGTKVVNEVEEWTDPGETSGMPLQVTYTWKLSGVPSWAAEPSFKDIPGMTDPVEETAMLQKTNKGYRAFGIPGLPIPGKSGADD